MSVLADFAAKMEAHNKAIDNAVDGLTADVANLKTMIGDLQTGQITPEDKAILDGIEAKAGVIADKLSALDALTPPAPPPIVLPPT